MALGNGLSSHRRYVGPLEGFTSRLAWGDWASAHVRNPNALTSLGKTTVAGRLGRDANSTATLFKANGEQIPLFIDGVQVNQLRQVPFSSFALARLTGEAYQARDGKVMLLLEEATFAGKPMPKPLREDVLAEIRATERARAQDADTRNIY